MIAFDRDVLKEEVADETPELGKARRQAELAQQELEKGFPLLHSQAVVSLCGTLDALIKDFLAAWITNHPEAKTNDKLRRVKVQLWEYDEMNPEEKSLYLVELLERDVSAPLKQGASRFETLLDIFQLGGQVEQAAAKDLFEMFEVRNAIVHHKRLADRRLVAACPWLGLSVGEPIVVTHESFGRYFLAATKYGGTVFNRVRVRYGGKPIWPFDETTADS